MSHNRGMDGAVQQRASAIRRTLESTPSRRFKGESESYDCMALMEPQIAAAIVLQKYGSKEAMRNVSNVVRAAYQILTEKMAAAEVNALGSERLDGSMLPEAFREAYEYAKSRVSIAERMA